MRAGDHQVLAVRADGLKKVVGIAPQVAVQDDLTGLVFEDAGVHGTGVEVDAAAVAVLARVEARWVPSWKDE